MDPMSFGSNHLSTLIPNCSCSIRHPFGKIFTMLLRHPLLHINLNFDIWIFISCIIICITNRYICPILLFVGILT